MSIREGMSAVRFSPGISPHYSTWYRTHRRDGMGVISSPKQKMDRQVKQFATTVLRCWPFSIVEWATIPRPSLIIITSRKRCCGSGVPPIEHSDVSIIALGNPYSSEGPDENSCSNAPQCLARHAPPVSTVPNCHLTFKAALTASIPHAGPAGGVKS
jgi:hypothetical protein